VASGVLFPGVRESPTFPQVRLGCPSPGRQVLAFRLLRGGFRAPVSAGDFSISVSAGRRPVDSGQRAVRRAPFRIRRTPARVHGIGRLFGRPEVVRHCRVNVTLEANKRFDKNFQTNSQNRLADAVKTIQLCEVSVPPARRWWRCKPLQPSKGSQSCLSRSCHQTTPAGRTRSRLRCLRSSTANRARPLPP
jgi:hypothetical protein